MVGLVGRFGTRETRFEEDDILNRILDIFLDGRGWDRWDAETCCGMTMRHDEMAKQTSSRCSTAVTASQDHEQCATKNEQHADNAFPCACLPEKEYCKKERQKKAAFVDSDHLGGLTLLKGIEVA